MAGHLAKKGGHDVTVFNRTAAKGGEVGRSTWRPPAKTPAEAADGADFVFSCVGNDDDPEIRYVGSDGRLPE
jgi:3-hydroxyisobutyrate dehydrogenase-like beta-hydroxyacid dehydrogenase